MKKILFFTSPLFLLLLLFHNTLLAHEPTSVVSRAQQPVFELRPYFAAITVKNIDSAIAWYKKTLGLEERNRVDSEEKGFKQAVLTGSGVNIELVELKSMLSAQQCLENQPTGTELLGYYKIGFVATEFDGLIKHFEGLGVSFLGKVVADRVSGQKTFLITDPDGNLIQFFDR